MFSEPEKGQKTIVSSGNAREKVIKTAEMAKIFRASKDSESDEYPKNNFIQVLYI